MCDDCLDHLGLPYHPRRGSDKRQVADFLLADIMAAFDKLDGADKFPAIFCEATDLIKLPSLNLDPVSKKLDDNVKAVESLGHVVQNLPSNVSLAISEPLEKCCAGIDKLVSEIKLQLNQFLESVNSSVKPVSSPAEASASNLKGHANTSPSSKPGPKYDRSNNVVLFGLPETSLMETKSATDDLSMHLIGKSIKIVDAFRLGRKSELTSARLRPLLIKFDNYWDRRLLLAACHKLKGYSESTLFLRKDLPPDARSWRPNINVHKKAASEGNRSLHKSDLSSDASK